VFYDQVFENNMFECVKKTFEAYEGMRHMDVMKHGFDIFNHFVEDYRLHTHGDYRRDLMLKFIEL